MRYCLGMRKSYPTYLHFLPFLPITVAAINSLSPDANGTWRLVIPSIFVLIYVYVKQLNYMKTVMRRSTNFQKKLLLAGFIVPGIAAIAGDIYGGAHFGAAAASVGGIFLAFYGLLVGIILMNLLAVGNVIVIATNDRYSTLRILGKVMYTIYCAALAVVAYCAFGIAYSLRDPNLE